MVLLDYCTIHTMLVQLMILATWMNATHVNSTDVQWETSVGSTELLCLNQIQQILIKHIPFTMKICCLLDLTLVSLN